MSLLLAQQMATLRAEAKANFNSDTIYFLDAPNLEHLGFKVQLLGSTKEHQEVLLRLKDSSLYQHISESSRLIDQTISAINEQINAFIKNEIDLKVKLVDAQLVDNNQECASRLRMLEINSFLAQQCKLKNSIYFVNSLKAYLQLYPLAYLLKEQGYQAKDLNLNLEILSGFSKAQKEQIKQMSEFFSSNNDACSHLDLVAKLAQAICEQPDLGIIYGCSLLGLEGLLDAYHTLLRISSDLDPKSFINKLAQSFNNEQQATLLRFNSFINSDCFIRFSAHKDEQHFESDNTPKFANKNAKGLELTIARSLLNEPSNNLHSTGLVLTNAASSEIEGLGAKVESEPNEKTKSKDNTQKSGLVLTNAASSEIEDLGTKDESIPTKKTKSKENTQNSGLVLTNAASSEIEDLGAKEESVPTKNTKIKDNSKKSGLVLTNAASSEIKGLGAKVESVPSKKTKSKDNSKKSGLVLTNAASSEIDGLGAKVESVPSKKTKSKENTQNSSLVITNAASSEIDGLGAKVESVPSKKTKSKDNSKKSGLVITNAAYSEVEDLGAQEESAPTKKTKSKENTQKSGLVLTNAASIEIKELDAKEESVPNEKTNSKENTQKSGLVLTNAASIEIEGLGTKDESVPAKKTKSKDNTQNSSLVLTNAASIEIEDLGAQEESVPAKKTKSKDNTQKSGLVLTNAASIEIEELGAKEESAPTKKTKSKDNTQKSGLVLTNAASIEIEDLGAKEESVPNKKTNSKDNTQNSGLVLTNAASSEIEGLGAKVESLPNEKTKSKENTQNSSLVITNAASSEIDDSLSSRDDKETINHNDIGNNFGYKKEELVVQNFYNRTAQELPNVSNESFSQKAQERFASILNRIDSTLSGGDTKKVFRSTTQSKEQIDNSKELESKSISLSENSSQLLDKIKAIAETLDSAKSKASVRSKVLSTKSEQADDKKTKLVTKEKVSVKNNKHISADEVWNNAVDKAQNQADSLVKVVSKEEFEAAHKTESDTLLESEDNIDQTPDDIKDTNEEQTDSKEPSIQSTVTGTAFSPFDQARRTNIKVLASRHANNKVASKDAGALYINKGTSKQVSNHDQEALRSFDPITGSYIQAPSSPQEQEQELVSTDLFEDQINTFDENLIFGDEEDFELWEPSNIDSSEPSHEQELDLDKVLDCSNELIKLKYCLLFAQSFLLDQEQYQKLMSAKNVEQLKLYSQLMASFDEFEELSSNDHSELPDWHKTSGSVLNQVVGSLNNLPDYKSVMFDILSNNKDELLSLTKYVAKFTYYRRVIGAEWKIRANNEQGLYGLPHQTSLENVKQDESVSFVLACLFLNASHIHKHVTKCQLKQAYQNCNLNSPI